MAQQGFPRGPPSYSGPPGSYPQPPRGSFGPPSSGGIQQQQPPRSNGGGFPPQQQHQAPHSGGFQPHQHMPQAGVQAPRSVGGLPQGPPFQPARGIPQPNVTANPGIPQAPQSIPPQQFNQPGQPGIPPARGYPQQVPPAPQHASRGPPPVSNAPSGTFPPNQPQTGFPPRGPPMPPQQYPPQSQGQPATFQQGPPPNFQQGAPPAFQQGQPPNFQQGAPPVYQQGPPPNFQQGAPPAFHHQGPPPAFQQGPPPMMQHQTNQPPHLHQQGQPLPPPHMMGNPNEPVFTPGPPFHQANPTAAPVPRVTPPAAQHGPTQRIDPNQIPRPLSKQDIITYIAKGPTLTMPPPANSKYICLDEGCASPRFIRPSLNHVPETKDLLNQSGLPLGAILCPLAKLQPGELPIPLVDFGPSGPLRCTRCKAYINCFTKFIQGGRMFACNICGMQNETPREYYCSVDQMGKRRDVMERMELARGTVEFIVPSAYSVRPSQEVIVVFCLDVSVFSFQSNLVASIVATLPSVLETLEKTSPNAKFGLMTFDTAVHYYRLDQEQISMCVCPDVDDPAAPVPAQAWLLPVNAPNAMDKILQLQDLIVSLFGANPKNQAVSGAAVTSAVDSLLTSGGRICLFHAGPPRLGIGKITKEEAASSYGTTKEVELYAGRGVHAHYEELARLSAKSFISIDIMSVANPYSDLAEVARLSELTGGYVVHLPQFEKDKPEHFQYCNRLLTHWLGKEKGMEAVIKIRVSTGLRVDSIYGNYMPSGASDDEINLALLDQDKAIGVTFLHDSRLTEEHMYIQVALLYTRVDGIRCVRVHNLGLPVANLVTNVFRHADLDTTCGLWQRTCIKLIRDKSIMSGNGQAVKERLIENCVQVLANYRKYCATNSSSGQLILPESLKLLPLYTLASLKSRALRNNLTGQQARGIIDVRADERVMLLHELNHYPVEYAVSSVYPKMYALHDLTEEIGTTDESGEIILPISLPPTAEKLEENGIFLLHSSTYLYMFIGAKINPTILQDIFGVSHVDTSEQSIHLVGNIENTGILRQQIQSIVSFLQMKSPLPTPLEIISKSDWKSNRFLSCLVEDRTRNEVSYVEFLCQIHKKIQYKMM